MPRNYKKKTDRGSTSDEQFIRAANLVKDNKMTIRAAAKQCGINRMTLARFITTKKVGYESTSVAHRVFTDIQETQLAKHIKDMADCFHGMGPEKCRKLAFDFARLNQVQTPTSWSTNAIAGEY